MLFPEDDLTCLQVCTSEECYSERLYCSWMNDGALGAAELPLCPPGVVTGSE